MYVSAGVGDVAIDLPVLEPCVQSHYFLDTPCILMFVAQGGVCDIYCQTGPHETNCLPVVYISSSENEMMEIYYILRLFFLLCLCSQAFTFLQH
jgi:hypothetical protein